jgi:vacuolar-type H+-ATPase subunit H
MLQKIQKVEAEIAQRIAEAQKEVDLAIQKASIEITEARSNLEEELRQKEIDSIAKAEAEANAEANQMIQQAEKEIANRTNSDIENIADKVLQTYLK